MLKKYGFIIAIVLSALFYGGDLFALTIGPARFEVRLPPGEIADADYYVQNDTNQPAHIVVEPENWFKEAYDYGKLGIKDWVEFDIYEFDLKPKEIKKLRLRIKVPKDVKGELVAQIFFTSSVLTEDGKPSEGIKARLGGVLYVAIKGTEIVDAEIKSIAVSNEFNEKTKEMFKIGASVSNKGNVHIRPAGKVTIEDEAGKKLIELDMESGELALPGQEILYNASWDNAGLKAGEYKASVTIKYGKELDVEKTAALEKIFEVGEDGKAALK
ncbi:MAG: hypothetical protein NTY34_00260 [Candidatus Omnitrophica bacterium]|nr:hypothetical protein [Candidatus Omnitrophota bacterium]